MKTNLKVGLALAIGTLFGAAGNSAIHGQQTKSPLGYVIAEVEATDPAALQKYAEKVPETLKPFHYRYVVRSRKIQSLEGEPPKGGIVEIEFDSVEKAREWYDSPAYSAIKPIRQSASKSRMFIVEGLPAE